MFLTEDSKDSVVQKKIRTPQKVGQESQCIPYAGYFFTKCCCYLLYAYNGASVSTNQVQFHKTFLFHKLSKHFFLCI